jgi:hypothetical protein
MKSFGSNLAFRNLASCVAVLLAAPGAWGAAASASTAFIASPGEGAAEDLNYVLRAGVSYTDNLFRAPPGLEVSAGAATFGLTAAGLRTTGRLNYKTAIDLSYSDYFSHYSDQIFGGGMIGGTYAIVPDTFFWNGSVDYHQVRRNVADPMALGNMGGQTMWSTGPELHLRMGQVMEAQLSGHYEEASYPGVLSQSGNNTVGGRALLVRRANPLTQMALGASYDDVTYDQRAVADVLDFKRHEVFVSYQNKGSRSRIEAELGYAGVSGATISDNGVLFRGLFARRLTPILEGTVSYNHEYPTSSPATVLSDPSLPVGTALDDRTLLTAAPRITDTVDASLWMRRPRTEAQLSYSLRRENSLAAGVGTRDYDQISLSVSRRFTPRATGNLYVSRSNELYSEAISNADETRAGGSLMILLAGSLGLDLQIQYRDRKAKLSSGSSNELAGGIFLSYTGALGRRQSLGNRGITGLR